MDGNKRLSGLTRHRVLLDTAIDLSGKVHGSTWSGLYEGRNAEFVRLIRSAVAALDDARDIVLEELFPENESR